MKAATINTGKLTSPEKPSKQTISIIVPFAGKIAYAQELVNFLNSNDKGDDLQEIIFINISDNEQIYQLQDRKKVRILNFAGASYSKCLELGAFEASGDILFLLKAGTFPVPNFVTTILASTKKTGTAGVVKNALAGWGLQLIKPLLPFWCILCFIKVDNFFITRHMFYNKTKYVPRKEIKSFESLVQLYAALFKAKFI